MCSATARAGDLSVLGMKLGAPIPYPECKRERPLFPKDPPRYEIVTNFSCVRDLTELAPRWQSATVMLSSADKPFITPTGWVRVFIRDGVLVGVDFETHGITTQSIDLRTLTEKFGPPTQQGVDAVANRMGAKYESINAHWALEDGATADFTGTMTRLDSGSVRVDLPAAKELRTALNARIDKLLNPGKL